MKASPAPTVSTTSTGRGRTVVSPSAVNAVAPPAPRVSTTSWVRSPPRRVRATSSGSAAGSISRASSSLSFTSAHRRPEVEHLAADARAVVDERLPQVGVVADEDVAGTGLLDEVEHALAPGLEQGAERPDVQRAARRELPAGQAPLQVEVIAGRPGLVETRGGDRRTPGRGGYGDELGAAAGHVLDHQPAALVVADLADQRRRDLEPDQPDRHVQRGAARCLAWGRRRRRRRRR